MHTSTLKELSIPRSRLWAKADNRMEPDDLVTVLSGEAQAIAVMILMVS